MAPAVHFPGLLYREHQSYSLTYQTEHNAAYAADNDLEIVETYSDAGLSGLTFKRRPALRRLIADVLNGEVGFQAILVYDVSRWGRFQDPDQAAHYEFMCREAGVSVIYTAESFASDLGPAAGILKHLKRTMAADFSRDLSAKVHRSKRGLRRLGFWTGGPPGYGLRRRMTTISGMPHLQMEAGEQKALRGYRTVLVHGPEHEVEVVRRIYRQFLIEGLRPVSIAAQLNAESIPAEAGARWTVARIQQVLTSEKYAGAIVGRKSVHRLGLRVPQPRSTWERVVDAVAPVIDRMYDCVQAQFRRPKARAATDAVLLAELRQVLADHGVERIPHCASPGCALRGCLQEAVRRPVERLSPSGLHAHAASGRRA